MSEEVMPVDETVLRDAAAQVDPPLLAALVEATGDWSVLREDLRPDSCVTLDLLATWTPQVRARAEQVADDALRRWCAAGCPPGPALSDADLKRLIEFTVGEQIADPDVPFLAEELGRDDPRRPGWTKQELDPGRPFQVAIVGAGMSGLLAAHRLQQAGISYVVLEKNDDVGGTWLENTYPGCRVDVTNHVYSYSFDQRADWPYYFSTQGLLLDYFRRFARERGLLGNIRFRTSVQSAEFDEARCGWRLRIDGPEGAEDIEADAIILAVGQLNRPKLPDIPGIDDFDGPSFHSARWDHDIDLTGKRVALVGTGASGAQIIPELAETAGELLVFQRTPPWVLPAANYRQRIPDGKRWLFDHVPAYHRWYRLWNFCRSAQVLLPFSEVDPDWTERSGSLGPENEALREQLSAHLAQQFADRPDLLPKVTPDYPPLAKRVVFDDGTLLGSLKRDNVQLVTDRVSKITASGVSTEDTDHEVDVIVYATGFAASGFFTPIRIRGREGVDLHEWWRNDPRAYLGMMVPGFPNLFSLYGPNTNIVVNGSIFYFSECAVRYVTGCLRTLFATGEGAIEVREEVYTAYNDEIDEANARRVWANPGVSSWYKNATGRVSQVWPMTMPEYRARTLAPRPGEHRFLPRPG